MIRFALALATFIAFAASVRAADVPAGTWAANVDGTKGDFVIKEVKGGKVTGSMLGTDFTGVWDGKTLTFQGKANETFEAHLVSEPGEKGQIKYTLTGTRSLTIRTETRVGIHVTKTGWYAQLTGDAPKPDGEIKAEVRGTLVIDGNDIYVSVKRKDAANETRVWLVPQERDWKAVLQKLTPLSGKEVVATGSLFVSPKDEKGNGPPTLPGAVPPGALGLSASDVKPAPAPK